MYIQIHIHILKKKKKQFLVGVQCSIFLLTVLKSPYSIPQKSPQREWKRREFASFGKSH